ncbi:leucine-rich repeat domain-containing protein [Tenacibaculum maritimum]|uniref:leucine-rich repeat domain-containing protein n=1 Tax=Tenacibaculum maritimum TaxID=107401 RepID=UPI0038904180
MKIKVLNIIRISIIFFTVNIFSQEIPENIGCLTPILNFEATSIEENSVILTWIDSMGEGDEEVEVIYGKKGFNRNRKNQIKGKERTNTSVLRILNLKSGTEYDVYIKLSCQDDSYYQKLSIKTRGSKKQLFRRVRKATICSVSQEERAALVAFYNATNGQNWTNSWDLTKPVCEWYGVKVKNGKVTELNFWKNNLVGIIPPEIGKLVNLTRISISSDKTLTGTIPKEIGSLRSLEMLFFHTNSLEGEIPKELGKLTNLKGLYLTNTNLTGAIPKEIGNLTSLTSLSLGSNKLTGKIPIEIGKLVNLKSLYLGKNNLTGAIPKEIGKLRSLVSISLAKNNLTGSIPVEISNLVKLISFSVIKNRLTGVIPEEIGNLSMLSSLALYENQLEGKIPSTLQYLKNLRYISLQRNRLSGEVPLGLSQLPKLEILYLSGNRFSGRLPAFNSKVLKRLAFAVNRFVFSDFENEHLRYKSELLTYSYNQQTKVDKREEVFVTEGKDITLTSKDLTSINNSYRWYKDGVAIPGATNREFVISNAEKSDAGTYYFKAKNSIIERLELKRHPIILEVKDRIVSTCPFDKIVDKNDFRYSNVTENSVKLVWFNVANEDLEGIDFQLDYGISGEIDTFRSVIVPSSETGVNIEGLLSDTRYEFYLKAKCQSQKYWIGPLFVKTKGASFNIDIEAVQSTPGGSFRPMYKKKYVISGWVKEKNTEGKQVFNYGRSAIRLATIAIEEGALKPPVFIGDFYPRGAIVDGWQRIEGFFTIEVPKKGRLLPNNLIIELINTDRTSKVTSYFDDIRIYPFNGSMKSFVYDNKTKKLMAELDENNYATFYEYDQEGGLIRVKKETTKGVFTIQETRSSNAKRKNEEK